MTTWTIADLPPEIREHVTIAPVTGCWVYGGALLPNGYGVLHHEVVHRTVYKKLVGPIPHGMTVDHVKTRGCRSKACCWPAHLEVVTRPENSRRNALWNAGLPRRSRSGLPILDSTDFHRSTAKVLSRVCVGQNFEIQTNRRQTAVIVSAEWYERASKALGEGGEQRGASQRPVVQ